MSTSEEQLRTEEVVGRSNSMRPDGVYSKGNRAAKRRKPTTANISRSGQQLNKCFIYLSCVYVFRPPL